MTPQNSTIPVSLTRPALWLGLFLGLFSAFTASAAVTWHDVQFGGFISQGYLDNSGVNNYIGGSSEGTFDFREYAANASWSKGKFRVGAQVFGQKLGFYGKDKIKLDWATIDYQAAQAFGVRVGRVKMPRGLYNEALDLDSVRPSILLPQSVYDARLRDFNASFDGGMAYGNIGAGKVGSFDYKVFYGGIPVSSDSGANDFFNSDKPMFNLGIKMDSALGGSLFWNTPLSGLRAGYSYSEFKNLTAMRNNPAYTSTNPSIIAGLHSKAADKYPRHLFSAEYVRGDWTFATEYGREVGKYKVHYINVVRDVVTQSTMTSYYVSAARRINSRFEVGAYYDHFNEDDITPGGPASKHQIDHVLSVRFDVNDHLTFKLEGHYLDGAGKVLDTLAHPQPPATLDQHWTMVAVKATYSF